MNNFDESKHLWDTTRSSKTTQKVYLNLLIKIFLVKGVGVVYMFSVPIF